MRRVTTRVLAVYSAAAKGMLACKVASCFYMQPSLKTSVSVSLMLLVQRCAQRFSHVDKDLDFNTCCAIQNAVCSDRRSCLFFGMTMGCSDLQRCLLSYGSTIQGISFLKASTHEAEEQVCSIHLMGKQIHSILCRTRHAYTAMGLKLHTTMWLQHGQ